MEMHREGEGKGDARAAPERTAATAGPRWPFKQGRLADSVAKAWQARGRLTSAPAGLRTPDLAHRLLQGQGRQSHVRCELGL